MSRPLPAVSGNVVTAPELRRLGLALDVADRQVRLGRWQRAARGIYLTHSRAPSGGELVEVARCHAGDGAVITGMLVLHQLGLRWLPPYGRVDVLVSPERSGLSSGLVLVTRTSCFESLETWAKFGGRLASVERAVVDAARGLSDLRDVRGVVLGAVKDRWADVAELRTILDAGRRNGSGLTRRALRDAERGCASPPEAELVDALIGCGLPFYVNAELWLDGVLLGSPDVWFVGRGVGGEVESRERHELEDSQIESTYDRHERFVAGGVELLHVSVRRIRCDVAEAASYLVARARGSTRAESSGLEVRPRGPMLR